MSDFALWNEIGKIHLKLGAYDEAIAAYRRAIELAPQWGWSYGYLAMAYCQKGDFAAAVPLYQKAIELVDNDNEKALLWNRLGDAYRRLNDYEQAMHAYRRADELEAAARAALSSPVSSLDRLSAAPERKAEADFSTARLEPTLSVSPAAPPLVETRPPVPTPSVAAASPRASIPAPRPAGEVALVEEEKPLPAAEVPLAVESQPTPPKASATAFLAAAARAGESAPATVVEAEQTPLTTAVSAEDREPTRRAETLEKKASLYKRITDINPTNDRAWDTLGLSLKALGKYEEAAAAFKQAIALRPDREVYHYHLGLVYAAQKKHQEAVEAFRKVVELNPNYVLAHGALAGSYRRLGMYQEAEQHIQIAMPQMQLENEYNRACFEAICGNHDQAIVLLKMALEKKQTTLEWMRCDPDLDSLRTDPRFAALMQQSGST